MTDCPNADMRDQLPDLVSGALSGSARALVQAHVDGCVECNAEVALLKGIRGMMIAETPIVDAARVQAIVAALPAPPRRAAFGQAPVVVSRGNRMAWRIAATVVFMALGGTLVVLRGARQGVPLPDSAAIIDGQALQVGASSPELALPGDLDSLSTDQLKSLLNKIDHLDGLPPAVPDVSDPTVGAGGLERPDTSNGGSRTLR